MVNFLVKVPSSAILLGRLTDYGQCDFFSLARTHSFAVNFGKPRYFSKISSFWKNLFVYKEVSSSLSKSLKFLDEFTV